MTFEGKQHGAGLVVRCTEHDRCAPIRQLDQERIGPCHAMRMNYNCCDLIQRDKADCLALLFNLQKAAIPREVSAILAYIYNLVQQRSPARLIFINFSGDSDYFQTILVRRGPLFAPFHRQ